MPVDAPTPSAGAGAADAGGALDGRCTSGLRGALDARGAVAVRGTMDVVAAPSPSLRRPAPLPRGFPRRFPVRDDDRRPLRYRVVSLTSRLAARALLGRRLHIEGAENVPERGPLLIACNHLSNLDPFLIGGFTPGTNYAMAKRELYANPLLAWLWAGCNCFPVDRGAADRWALRTALAILERGGHLVIWVEGTRAAKPGMKRAEAGVGFLLRRSRAPVLPVALWGTEVVLPRGRRLPRRADVTLRFGTPERIDVDALGDNQAVADAVARRIAALLPPQYRGFYADAVGEGDEGGKPARGTGGD